MIALELDRPAMDIPVITTAITKPLNLDPVATASSWAKKLGWKGQPGSAFASNYEPIHVTGHYGEDVPKVNEHKARKAIPEDIKKARPWLGRERGHVWRFWMGAPDDAQPWLACELEEPTSVARITERGASEDL